MGGKNLVQSFSYNMRDMDTIEQCLKMAKDDGVSFSEFIVSLLKEQARQKNALGSSSPIGIQYHSSSQENKPLQTDLLPWLDIVAQVREHKELSKLKGQALEIARRVDRQSMELRRQGIKQ